MNVSELTRLLHSLGTHPKRGLSQNFLIDNNIIAKFVETASVQEHDYLLEVGAGLGALTEAFVAKGAEVIAVELDSILAETLKRAHVTVFHEDILNFSFEHLQRKAKVVGNLPYHITAPILARCIPRRDLFSTITVVVQEEVARRITAPVRTAAYGSLTLFLRFYSTPQYAFRVSRRCFYPTPKVDSAVVTFTLQDPPHVDADAFFTLVRTAFQQRRKMLKNTLGVLYPVEVIHDAFKAVGIDAKARPEELELMQFLALFTYLEKSCFSPPDKGGR